MAGKGKRARDKRSVVPGEAVILIRCSDEDGFIFVEVLVAAAIMGIVLAGIFSFHALGVRSWEQGVNRMERRQNIRIALDMIIKELWQAAEIKNIAALRDVQRLETASEITFYKIGSKPHKRYRFRLSGEQVVFESFINGATHSYNVLALGVADMRFIASAEDVITIEISAGDGKNRIMMRSAVQPRNLNLCMGM